ncbi:MAG: sigma-70 family RNA polymerase sigma factor [Clostridiales bacterium]|nr:sigma-70 family RNA polymerase sigma factor [Clostridiales bacterium]
MNRDVTACYHKYKNTIYKLAYTYCRNTAQAEDVFQEVLYKYMIHQPRFQDEDHEKAWFVRTTINTCKDILKSKWMRTTVPLEEWDTSEKKNFDEDSEGERYADLRDAVLSLPDLYRLPIHLYYYEEYSVREIAQILHRKESAVQTQLQRGREKIRQFLEKREV